MQLSLGTGAEAPESREAFARRTIRHAFERNPNHVWTREGLATWYAIPLNLVERILSELIAAGSVRPTLEADGYRAVVTTLV